MNRRLLFFALYIGSVAISGCAHRHGNEIAVAFYNCENFFDTKHDAGKEDQNFTPYGKYHYTQKIYAEKQRHIATVIQKMGAEDGGAVLVGLSEVENATVLSDLVSQPEIASLHYKYEWFDGPDPRGINVALLYNPSRFVVLSAEPLHVDLSAINARSKTRDVLYVYGILDGDTVQVFVNHWPSRRGDDEGNPSDAKRAIAATVVKNKIDSLIKAAPATQVIIMGDLNDNPIDAGVTQVLGASGDSSHITSSGLYDPWAAVYNNGSTGTEEFGGAWNLFDQIIISGNFLHTPPAATKLHKLHFEKAEIFKPGFIIDHYGRSKGYPYRSFAGTHWIHGYSDHFPVVMYLTE